MNSILLHIGEVTIHLRREMMKLTKFFLANNIFLNQ